LHLQTFLLFCFVCFHFLLVSFFSLLWEEWLGERVVGAFWVLPIFSDGFWNQLHGVWVTMAFCFWKVFSLFLSLGETNDRVLRFFVSEEEFYLMGFSSGSRTMCPRFSTTSVQMWW
jgi:hypothetical protein